MYKTVANNASLYCATHCWHQKNIHKLEEKLILRKTVKNALCSVNKSNKIHRKKSSIHIMIVDSLEGASMGAQ